MTLAPTVDPSEVGIDPDRVARIDAITHRYVDEGKFPFVQFLLLRRGEIVHTDLYGVADVDSKRPIRDDAIVRIYSMTKPITSVALMRLYEEGKVLLEDPVSKYLPSFENARVYVSGDETSLQTREPARPPTVHDMLTHMSGLTYGFQRTHPVDAIYRANGLGEFNGKPRTLTETMELLGTMPLQFSPGTGWCYSMSTDVCGALVEVINGKPLDESLEELVCGPLGMVDTAFWVDGDDRRERFVSNYMPAGGGMMLMDSFEKSTYFKPPVFLGGGGGLVSTMADYLRFATMLLNGGELDGVRLLSNRTLAFMASNHLPDGRDLNSMGQVGFSESLMNGMGFGLGFGVMVSPQQNGALASAGEYGWGGAASTAFRVDPKEELTWIYLTQLLPSSTYPIRRELYAAVYQALID